MNWIDRLNGLSEVWVSALWRASWQGGLFIVVVWAICRFVPRMPASTRHWLWWIASAQLMARLFISTPIALPLLPAPSSVGESVVNHAATPNLPKELESETHGFMLPTKIATTFEPPVRTTEPSGTALVLLLWIAGLGFCLTNTARRLVRTRSLLQGRTLVGHHPVTSVVHQLSEDLGVKSPDIRESRKAPCPLLAGWIRPAIVLPLGAADQLSETELRMAIAHELIHLRRRDLWLCVVPDFARTLFFFHPLAWLTVNESAAAREEACDTEAIRLSGGSLAAYARLLLNSAHSNSNAAVLGAAFGYRLIERRITMLKSSSLTQSTFARWAFSSMVGLGVLCALPWTVTAQTSKPGPATSTHEFVVVGPMKAAKARTLKGVGLKPGHTTLTLKAKTLKGSPLKPAHLKAITVGVTLKPAHKMPINIMAGARPGQQTFTVGPISAPAASSSVGTTPAAPTVIGRRYAATAPVAGILYSGATSSTAAPGRAPYSGMAPARTFSTGTVAAPGVSVSGRSLPASPMSDQSTTTTPAAPFPAIVHGDAGRYSLELDKTSLHQTLKQFFGEANIDFVIRSDVRDDSVTVRMSNAKPDAILQAILKSVKQPLTYRIEAGVYYISPKG